MYRTLDTALWTDPKMRALPDEAFWIFIYLVTNPHSHVSGIYYLPDALICHEARISAKSLNTVWDTLSAARLAYRDTVSEVVWVRKMFDRQGRGAKNNQAAAEQLKTLHNCKLIKDFMQFYACRKIPYTIPYSENSLQEQEQEREQDQQQDQDQEIEDCPDAGVPDTGPTPAVVFLTFPCVSGERKGPPIWELTQEQVCRWSELYTAVDVPNDCRKALAWIEADQKRYKTAGGMAKFLTSWLGRSQDHSNANPLFGNGNGRGNKQMPTGPGQSYTPGAAVTPI